MFIFFNILSQLGIFCLFFASFYFVIKVLYLKACAEKIIFNGKFYLSDIISICFSLMIIFTFIDIRPIY